MRFIMEVDGRGADQRDYIRIRVSYEAEVRLHGSTEMLRARVLDLSGSGIRLWLPVEVASDAAFAMRMEAADAVESVVVSAHAVRVAAHSSGDGWEVACRFD